MASIYLGMVEGSDLYGDGVNMLAPIGAFVNYIKSQVKTGGGA